MTAKKVLASVADDLKERVCHCWVEIEQSNEGLSVLAQLYQCDTDACMLKKDEDE